MFKILIVDYIGNSNSEGVPIGHPTKVINEFGEILKNDVELNLAVPVNYKNYIKKNNFYSVKYLRYNIDITEKRKVLRIKNVFRKFKNIRMALKNSNFDVVWFINVDSILGISLLSKSLFYSNVGRIWITTYLDNYFDGNTVKDLVKNFFWKNMQKKCDTILSSCKKLNFNDKVIFIPDYIYEENIYNKYKNAPKTDQVICIGTMNDGKDLEGIICLFNKLNVKLKIIGNFYNKDMYKSLIEMANSNIIIEDKIQSYYEYYKSIAESKFVIIPYKKEFYQNRTSGVLQETMFLNSIPIAPDFLLKFNNVKGIGYNKLFDLKNFFESGEYKKVKQPNNDFSSINNPYNKACIKNKLINILCKDDI